MPAKPAPLLDPYLTLGLEPGAPMADVKRAYRRLAKAFHPDSAGEAAIPRFLAIQAAYEQIRTGRVTLGGSRGARGGASSAAAGTAGEPWRADPARARAARERARAGTAGRATSGTASPGTASPGTAASGRGSSGSSGGATGSGRAGGQASGGRRATGTSGTSGAGTAGGTRKRATRKATMGSTSYDEARDPADATWSGASWYGPSTGEYWIVNPREYADPRKHGPDYQQRARRPLQDAAGSSEAGSEAATPRTAEPATPRTAEPTAEPVADPIAGATTTAGPTPTMDHAAPGSARPERRSRVEPRWSPNATDAGWAAAGDARRSGAAPEVGAPAPLRWLGEPADDPVRRFGLALVAWPPIGLVAAALIGEATGCATFSARCDGSEPLLPWLAQAVILGLLLLAPSVTRLLAGGTIAVLVGFVPLTSLLLAAGAAGASEAAPVLSTLLVVLWLVGVTWAVIQRVRGPGRRTGASPRAGAGGNA